MERRRRKKSSSIVGSIINGTIYAAEKAIQAYYVYKMGKRICKEVFGDKEDEAKVPQQNQSSNPNDRIRPNFNDMHGGTDYPHEEEEEFDCDDDECLCPINMTYMHDPYIITKCGHSFEKGVIYSCLKKKPECPLCKRSATVDDLIPNFSLKSILDKKKEEIKKKRKEDKKKEPAKMEGQFRVI